MTILTEHDLATKGVAEVIVILKDHTQMSMAAAADDTIKSITDLFLISEQSATTQIVAAAAAGYAIFTDKESLRSKKPIDVELSIPRVRYFPNLGVLFGTIDAAGLASLQQDPNVSEVTAAPDLSWIKPIARRSARAPNTSTWGIRALNIPNLWGLGLTGKNVLIGHLDTGVDGTHPALHGAIAHFAEFDHFGREVQLTQQAFDTDAHGTHTAATAVGRSVAGRQIGVAPDALLASAIVIEGGQVIARILGGMDWAVSKQVRILNMSLGLRGLWLDFLPIVQILRQRNILPIFAIGNEGPGTSRSPGNYAEAIAVGAHDRHWEVADFSSSQRFPAHIDGVAPDLVCPGVNIISAAPNGRYVSMDGTSMATPHLAGLAALLLEAKPTATVKNLEDAIFGSCSLKNGMLPERVNRGAPDAVKALNLL